MKVPASGAAAAASIMVNKNLSTALHILKAVVVNLTAPLRSANHTEDKKNKTKAIEEAVVSLPMASFALEAPKKVAQNKTVHKFPGNATQKAAWEKKEKALENEIKTLKARLANTSASLPK